jgi:hypothetical protein
MRRVRVMVSTSAFLPAQLQGRCGRVWLGCEEGQQKPTCRLESQDVPNHSTRNHGLNLFGALGKNPHDPFRPPATLSYSPAMGGSGSDSGPSKSPS